MKRPLTLSGAIIGTVANAVLTIVFIYNAAICLSYGAELTSVGILCLVECLFSLTALVLDIFSILAWNKDFNGYKKRKGIIITSVVFDFLPTLYLILNFIVVNLIFALALIAANVLKIIDLARENKNNPALVNKNPQVNTVNQQQTSVQQTRPQPVQQQVRPAQPVHQNQVQPRPVQQIQQVQQIEKPKSDSEKKFDALEKRLEKLYSMKEKGIVSEEEYAMLKNEIIKDSLGK